MLENHVVLGIEDDTPDPLFGVWPHEQNTEEYDEAIAKSVYEFFQQKAKERWAV